MVFDRYEIQSKPAEDTCSVNDDEHENWFVENNNNNKTIVLTEEGGDGACRETPTSGPLQSTTTEEELTEQPVLAVPQPREEEKEATKSWCRRGITFLQYTVSIVLLLFSLTLVVAAIVAKQTAVSQATHPSIALALLVGLLRWLGLLEGGQGCIVGLQPRRREASSYAQSHPWTYRCTQATVGPKLERFIVGRQFLVVLVVFGINLCGSPVADAEPVSWGFLPHVVVHEIFLASGLALILVTIVVGQLAAQVNSAMCLLDFINYRLSLLTVWAALAVEQSGLLHACYLVQMLFSRFTDQPFRVGSSSSRCSKIWFWARVVVSLLVLGFALAVTLTALFDGQTTVWEGGIPAFVSVIIFFVLMCFVGLMEGMQIALFAVVYPQKSTLGDTPSHLRIVNWSFEDPTFRRF